MVKRTPILRSVKILMTVCLSLVLGACVIHWKGSDFDINWLVPHIGPGHSNLKLQLASVLLFDRDLSVSVDNALARAREGDGSVSLLAKDFLTPGITLLATYGIGIEPSLPIVKHKKRRLEFDTQWSEWATPSELEGEPLCSEVFNTAGYNCELQARLQNAYAEFNPLMPRQISVHAVVMIHARRQSASDGGWVAAPVRPGGPLKLRSSLARQLAQRYQEYFERHGMHVEIKGPR